MEVNRIHGVLQFVFKVIKMRFAVDPVPGGLRGCFGGVGVGGGLLGDVSSLGAASKLMLGSSQDS